MVIILWSRTALVQQENLGNWQNKFEFSWSPFGQVATQKSTNQIGFKFPFGEQKKYQSQE
jgi:hypothetical protein